MYYNTYYIAELTLNNNCNYSGTVTCHSGLDPESNRLPNHVRDSGSSPESTETIID